MFTYGNLFEDILRDFNVNKEFKEAASNAVERIEEKVTIPMNIFKEEDGSNVIEIAAVGLSKEDIKISSKTENGDTYLYIKSNEKEKTEEEKTKEENRQYSIRKIKNLAKMDVKMFIPNALDIQKLSAKVVNGLLTIVIPLKEEAKPVEFTID